MYPTRFALWGCSGWFHSHSLAPNCPGNEQFAKLQHLLRVSLPTIPTLVVLEVQGYICAVLTSQITNVTRSHSGSRRRSVQCFVHCKLKVATLLQAMCMLSCPIWRISYYVLVTHVEKLLLVEKPISHQLCECFFKACRQYGQCPFYMLCTLETMERTDVNWLNKIGVKNCNWI